MRKFIAITAILTSTFVGQSILAADGVMPAALPGPYQSMNQPKLPETAPLGTAQNAAIPQPTQQNFWGQAPRQQIPYWMQNPQQPVPNNFGNQSNGTSNTQANGQVQGGFDFNAQAQAQAQGRNNNQAYGTGFAPGYFPGYGPAPQPGPNNVQPFDPRFAPQNLQFNQGYQVPQNPNQQGWNVPWNNNGPWGTSNFGPWGPVNPNNWQGGYPQGYGAPNGWGN